MVLEAEQMVEGRYRIEGQMGRGGMGTVYRAWDTRLNRAVALKELVPQPGLDAETLASLRRQFEQEARTLAYLSHPNLVRVSDYFSWEGRQYLVMDFVEGDSLADRIRQRGPQPEVDVVRWSEQLLDALALCHRRAILHRDVKPQNVIITASGDAVLVDFGLVKLWDPEDPHTRTALRGAGTPEYAPPEQHDVVEGHTDPRSDIYSLGATMYSAVTGRVPPTATQRMANPSSFVPPRQLNTALSPTVERTILKAMNVPMDERFQSAEEMARALKRPAQGASAGTRRAGPSETVALPDAAPPAAGRRMEGPVASQEYPDEEEPVQKGLRWLWIGLAFAAALCLALVVGGGAGYMYVQRTRSTPEPVVQDVATAAPLTTEAPTAAPTAVANPVDVRVAPDGSGQYATLAAAVAGVPAGSTIRLDSGRYELSQPLEVDKPLSLLGAGMEETEVVGSGEGYVIRFSGEGPFVAEGITFRYEGASQANVVVVAGGEIDFDGCRFTGASMGEGATVAAGLWLAGDTRGTVQNCLVTANESDGIVLVDQAQPALQQNACSANTERGIAYFDQAGGTARQNTCSDNGLHGIELDDGSSPLLEANTVSDNVKAGIRYTGNAAGEARQNECSGNGLSGIIVAGEAAPSMQGNRLTDNGESGIAFFDQAGGQAQQNECTGNGLHGISLSGAAQPTLENNVCSGNEQTGIRLAGTSAGVVRNNQCTGNGLSGIIVNDQAQPTLDGNSSRQNAESGIVYFADSGGLAQGNDCSENGLHGISVSDQARVILEENVCRGNVQAGVRFTDAASGEARQNEVSGNGLSGFIITGEAQVALHMNVCTENGEAGIAFLKDAGGSARQNECHRNKWGIYVEATANPVLEENSTQDNTTADVVDRRSGGTSGSSLVGSQQGEDLPVLFRQGDARAFDDPPAVAYADVEAATPPSGVRITDSGRL